MEKEQRIFPKSSAFELLLGKVYLELWELDNNDPAEFAKRVNNFVDHWFPWRKELKEKFPELREKLEQMDRNIKSLKQMQLQTDPLSADEIERRNIPEEEANYAREVWRAVREILKDKGFDFPIRYLTEGYPIGDLK